MYLKRILPSSEESRPMQRRARCLKRNEWPEFACFCDGDVAAVGEISVCTFLLMYSQRDRQKYGQSIAYLKCTSIGA